MHATRPALLCFLLAGAAHAQTLPAPVVSAGDSWTYQSTTEIRGGWRQSQVVTTVDHAGPTGIAVSSTPVGSTMPPTETLAGRDWERARSVNGRQTVVNRPLQFPLEVGHSWTVDYTEDHPNRQHSSEHYHTTYRVSGWTDVTVPAGTFHAMQVEADGTWSATIAPSVSAVAASRVDASGATSVTQVGRTGGGTVSGRTYKSFWYVGSVRRWVKSVEEYYDPNGIRTARYTDTLISFKVSAHPT